MPLSIWLKKTQLKRVERKLRRLRARQRQVRDKETQLKREKDRAGSDETTRKLKTLHDEKEALTREVNHLIVEEERIKSELRAAGESTAITS